VHNVLRACAMLDVGFGISRGCLLTT
jgi:hypothetical protein